MPHLARGAFVKHDVHRVVHPLGIDVHQTVELTFKNFASDRGSMPASVAIEPHVFDGVCEFHAIVDELGESFLTDDDLLSPLNSVIFFVPDCR